MPPPERSRTEIDVVRGDDAVTEPVDVIKLDVEGGELSALRGMERSSQDARALFLECNPDLLERAGASRDDILAWVAAHGFEAEWIDETSGRTRPLSDGWSEAYVNLVCRRPGEAGGVLLPGSRRARAAAAAPARPRARRRLRRGRDGPQPAGRGRDVDLGHRARRRTQRPSRLRTYDEVRVGRAEDELAGLAAPFDTILLYDVLEHLPEPWVVLRRLHDVAVPDARIHVSVPNARHWTLLRDLALRGSFGYGDAGHRDRTHLRWFTKRDLVELLEDTGWNVERVAHGETRPVSRLAERLTRGLSAEFLVYQQSALARRGSAPAARPEGEG